MRKLALLFATLVFAALPTLAQHGHGGGAGHSGGHAAVGGHAEGHAAAPVQHGQAHSEGRFHEQHGFSGYHYGPGAGEVRGHFNGGRFDHEFFAAHWGVGHPFFWGHCRWYGVPYYPGSWFWYGGVNWVIIDTIPDYWDDGEVYVDYVDGYGYALVNPLYPGVYFHVGIRF